ncbi:hypothetical protein ACHAXN_000289 [Cyclotella atomus]
MEWFEGWFGYSDPIHLQLSSCFANPVSTNCCRCPNDNVVHGTLSSRLPSCDWHKGT